MLMPPLFQAREAPPRGRVSATDAASAGILAAVAAFVALILLAMAEYPGGTGWDPTSHGNDFWLNYLCDLERTVARNGQPNPLGSALARAAVLVLASGLVFVWWIVPRLSRGSPRLGRAARVLGAVTVPGMLAVGLFPADRFPTWHPIEMILAGLPGLAAAAIAVLGLALEKPAPRVAVVVGGAAVVTAGVDFALYVRQLVGDGPGPTAGAILERVALILVLAWMCAIAWRARGIGRDVQRVQASAHTRAPWCTRSSRAPPPRELLSPR